MSAPREPPRFVVTPATDDIRHTYTITPSREAWRWYFAGQAMLRSHVGWSVEAIEFADRLLQQLENTKGEEDGEHEE